MRNGFEWLRLLTPIIAGINLFILSQVYVDVRDMSARIYLHQTNADLHITRSEFVAIQDQLDQMRLEIIQTIRQQKGGE